MTNNSSESKKRNIFKTANKYQTQIILLTFFPSILMYLFFIFIVNVGGQIFFHSLLHSSFLTVADVITRFYHLIAWIMCLFIILSSVVAFIISHHMVGAFGRIVYELDEIIAGRSKKIITSRPKDYLCKDILQRVNYLVKHYVVARYEKENP